MRRPIGLNRQLMLLGTIPTVAMFVVLLFFFTSIRLDESRQDLFDHTQNIAEHLAPNIEYPIVSGNRAALVDVLERSLAQSQLAWIRVRDSQGKVIGERLRESDQGVEPDDYFTFSADVLQSPVPIEASSQPDWYESNFASMGGARQIGTVTVAISSSQLNQRRFDILFSTFMVAGSVLLLTLLVIHQVAQRISSPIHRINRNINALREGHYQLDTSGGSDGAAEIRNLEQNIKALSYHLQHLKESRENVLAKSERALERVEHASQAKSQFLSVMSHELRTPLNATVGMLDLLKDADLPQEQFEQVVTARRATLDLLSLIDNILDFSRAERGLLTLQKQSFSVSGLVQNCVSSYRHKLETQGLSLALQYTDEWPENDEVVGDQGRLRQILGGLLQHALQFTRNTELTLACQCSVIDETTLSFGCEIRDGGTAMDRLSTFFRYTPDALSQSPDGSSGVQMALIQRLIELMGGHVSADDENGTGTGLYFEIPLELINANGRKAELSESPSVHWQGLENAPVALVVEDNQVNRRVACGLLRKLGFEPYTAEDGRVAVSMITEGPHTYDLVLMDCHMPVMDGLEATRCIRAWETAAEQHPLPIIALTADALRETERECRDAGMNDYLTKPVRRERLETVLARWVD